MIPPTSPQIMAPQTAPPNVGPDAPLASMMGQLLSGAGPIAAPPTDPYADDKALLKVFRDFHKLSFDQRWVYERNWWRNLLYVLGRQWIFYNQQRGAWQDKRMQKWVPRPVTNKMAEAVDTIRSVFQAVELVARIRPSTDNPKDTQTAKTAEDMEPMLRDEHKINFRTFESDFWDITLGNAFWHPYFDKNGGDGEILIPFEQCLSCQKAFSPGKIVEAGQTCPNCGGRDFNPQTDQQGNPVGDTFPTGHGATDICSPFEIGFPSGYGNFGQLPGIIRQRWRPREYYERFYPDFAKSLTFAKTSGERSLQLLKAIASQSDISGTALGSQTSDSSQQEGVTEYELFLKPTPTYPGGLVLRVVGGEGQEKVVRGGDSDLPGPLPLKTVKGQPIFPWIHTAYSRFGGRVWGRSPLDLIIQKQDQINQLDSLILLGVNRMSNPVWIEPKGAEVKKFTGEPGLVVKYNALAAGGNAKPERIEGSNIPSSLLKLREMYIADMETLAGTNDVLKGAKPSGVSAFSAMQLLVERAQSRFGPVLSDRGDCYRQWLGMALEIERCYGQDERIFASMGANRRWTFQTFKNADIQGSVEILIEDGSQAPKTNLGKRAAMEQLNNLGLLDPGNIDQKVRIYQIFGSTDLLPALDAAVQGALAEQAAFEEWAKSPNSMPAPMMGMGPQMPPMPGGQQPSRAYFNDEGPAQPPAGQPPAQAGPPPAPGGQPPVDPAQQSDQQMLAPPAPPPTMTPCPLVIEEWHPDTVHISEHEKFGNSDMARVLFGQRPDLKQVFTMHLLMHKQRLAMQQMQATMAAAPPGPAKGGGTGGPGGGRALQNSNQESGKRGANQAPPA
jgi:hypothetical protein